MFARNSALVLGVFLAVGVVIILGGRMLFLEYERSASELSAPLAISSSGTTYRPNRQVRSGAVVRRNVQQIRNSRLIELQTALDRTRMLLDQRTAQLNKRNSEYKELQTELDTSLDLLVELMGQSTTALALARDDGSAREVVEDPELLQAQLAEQAQQLEQMRAQLMDTDVEIAEIEMAAEREISMVQAEKNTVEQAARAAVAQFGIEAVPVLLTLTADERPQVRRWAVSVLGDLGLDAQDAIPTLIELLADGDQEVRAQAQRALARIDP